MASDVRRQADMTPLARMRSDVSHKRPDLECQERLSPGIPATNMSQRDTAPGWTDAR